MIDPDARATLESVYLRLLTAVASTDVSAERARAAAINAIQRAVQELERDPDWIETELHRLRATPQQGRDS